MPCGNTTGSLTSDEVVNLRAEVKTLTSGQAMAVAMNEAPNVVIQNIMNQSIYITVTFDLLF